MTVGLLEECNPDASNDRAAHVLRAAAHLDRAARRRVGRGEERPAPAAHRRRNRLDLQRRRRDRDDAKVGVADQLFTNMSDYVGLNRVKSD